MPLNSLEYNCEEVIMMALSFDERLANYETRHHESDEAASVNVLVVKALKGEKNKDGPKAHSVLITVTFASGTLTPDEADKVAEAMLDSVYDPAPEMDELSFPDLAVFYLEEECETVREDTKKLRKRIVRIPVLAKLLE